MASGDKINYSNYEAMYGSASWRKSQSFSKGYNNSWIIYCHEWTASMSIKGSGLWGFQEGSFYVDYLYPPTGEWVNVYGSSSSGKGSSYSASWSWSHNYNGGSSGDIPENSIWRIRIYIGNNSGSGSANVYWGGINFMSQAQYNAAYYGKKIIGVPVDQANNSLAWSYQNNALQGTSITAANGYQVTCLPSTISN